MVTGDVVFDVKKILVDLKGELWNARRGADDVFGMVLMAVERANGRRSANAMFWSYEDVDLPKLRLNALLVVVVKVLREWRRRFINVTYRSFEVSRTRGVAKERGHYNC